MRQLYTQNKQHQIIQELNGSFRRGCLRQLLSVLYAMCAFFGRNSVPDFIGNISYQLPQIRWRYCLEIALWTLSKADRLIYLPYSHLAWWKLAFSTTTKSVLSKTSSVLVRTSQAYKTFGCSGISVVSLFCFCLFLLVSKYCLILLSGVSPLYGLGDYNQALKTSYLSPLILFLIVCTVQSLFISKRNTVQQIPCKLIHCLL